MKDKKEEKGSISKYFMKGNLRKKFEEGKKKEGKKLSFDFKNFSLKRK